MVDSFKLEKVLSEAQCLCYMVAKGAKPAANIVMKSPRVDSVLERVNNYGTVKFHVQQLPDVEWCREGRSMVWMYKHQHILDVIKSFPRPPKTPFEHWVQGKLFGYSEDEIGKFIAQIEPVARRS